MQNDSTTDSSTYSPDSDATREAAMQRAENEALVANKTVISVTALVKIHDLLDYLNESPAWRELVTTYREILPPKPTT